MEKATGELIAEWVMKQVMKPDRAGKNEMKLNEPNPLAVWVNGIWLSGMKAGRKAIEARLNN